MKMAPLGYFWGCVIPASELLFSLLSISPTSSGRSELPQQQYIYIFLDCDIHCPT